MSIVSSVPAPRPSRNNFNLSRQVKGSTDLHLLSPVDIREILPGDFWRSSGEVFVRFAPMVAPVFQSVKVSLHSFFVPFREINSHFEEFITKGEKGTYNEKMPFTTLGTLFEYLTRLTVRDNWQNEVLSALRLFDFLGLPFVVPEFTGNNNSDMAAFSEANKHLQGSPLRVNLAPFLCYVKIYDEYYRDQNLEDSLMDQLKEIKSAQTGESIFDSTGSMTYFPDDDIAIADILFRTRLRAWRKDRFTAALPFTQRGPDVVLPINGTAPVDFDWNAAGTNNPQWVVRGSSKRHASVASSFSSSVPSGNTVKAAASSGDIGTGLPMGYDPNGSLVANLENADLTTTINDFRRAERLQRWYENSARGGSRYNENTLSHWGVRTKDSRLDRAEFLGGSTQDVVISEVQQNSATGSGETPLGTLGGKATSYKGNRMYKRFFEEHGFIVTLMSVMVDASYQQGLPKIFSRYDSTEYAWPEFANLGEEPVYTKELYAAGGVGEADVFGYTPRYSDYKMAQSSVHGQFKKTLDFWTMSRKFANVPALNRQFVMSRPRLDAFAVTSEFVEHLYFMINLHTRASRLLPYYGVPTI